MAVNIEDLKSLCDFKDGHYESKKGQDYLNSIKKELKIYTNIKENDNLALAIELKVSKILDSIYNIGLFEKC